MGDVYSSVISKAFEEHHTLARLTIEDYKDKILYLSKLVFTALKNGSALYWCGNGGSASDSEHLSAELLGRFNRDRAPLRSISLMGESAKLTCLSNDYGFNNIFSSLSY